MPGSVHAGGEQDLLADDEAISPRTSLSTTRRARPGGVEQVPNEASAPNGAGQAPPNGMPVAGNNHSPPLEQRVAASREASRPGGTNKKGWNSWKLSMPWLAFVLALNTAFTTAILSLNFISKRDHGFGQLGNAPGFLERNPSLEKAIWEQGILYTAFPAFLMTIFQTCWHAAVAAAAKRQPFVELKSKAPARKTILLEYPEPFALSWYSALGNQHHLLAACMLSSATLAFMVVPLTSFLFTTSQPMLNSTLPLSVDTAFNGSILGQFPSIPSLRFMDTAAAIHIQGASPPPWTDGRYAYPKLKALKTFKGGEVTFESLAYSAHAECVNLEASSYRIIIRRPGDTGLPALTVTIFANDRGCQITSSVNFRLSFNSPKISIGSWTTTTCPAHAGWSRFSFLAVQVTDDHEIASKSIISCAPSYRTSFGNLTTNWDTGSGAPGMRVFQVKNESESRSDFVWIAFEMGFQAPGCFDPSADVDTNEFGRQVYRLASHVKPAAPLHPQALLESAQTMFTTMFAIFANLYLLPPIDLPITTTGTISVQPTRLIVVSPIAYIIVAILLVVAGLNIALFVNVLRKDSILNEDPVGLLGAASILHDSTCIPAAVNELLRVPGCKGKVVTTALNNSPDLFEEYLWSYDQGKIVRARQEYSDQQRSDSPHNLANISSARAAGSGGQVPRMESNSPRLGQTQPSAGGAQATPDSPLQAAV